MPRLFFVLPIPYQLKQKLIAALQPDIFYGIRWIASENLHITIHFLGNIPSEKVKRINRQAKIIADSHQRFELKFQCFQTIIKDRKPNMIWAQFEENVAFKNLCLKLQEELHTDEKREPFAHLTLARIKQLKNLPFDLPQLVPFTFWATQFELWQSHLHSDGSQYETLESYSLK